MNIRETLLVMATGLALLASPAAAGGPVITSEEAYEPEPQRKLGWIVPVGIAVLIIAAITSDNCVDPEAPPPSAPPSGCR